MLTQDPLGLAGGANLYEYAGSNPVAFADPFGLCCKELWRKIKRGVQGSIFGQINAQFDRQVERNRERFQARQPRLAAVLDDPIVQIAIGTAAGGIASGGSVAAAGSASRAESPIGSARSPLWVARGTNTPTTINGRVYTGHALDQMQARGLMPSVVDETIVQGTQTAGRGGATVYTTSEARVILNADGSVKTVMQQ